METWDDWDDGKEEPEVPSGGKIFGNRGRGFFPASRTFQSKVGVPSSKNNFDSNHNKNRYNDVNENDDNDDWECEYKSELNRRNGENRTRGPNKTEDGDVKKPKSTYVPDEPTEDENEIFGNGISSGINFNKYDDIEVHVSGENPPKPIHSFGAAGLRASIIDLIKKCNYNKPTPIQKYSIPVITSGRDLMACAQTGSGKTAAFLIPIINSLLENEKNFNSGKVCKPQAVIVSPTRELAIQIYNEARKFSRGTILQVAISYGGTAVFHQMQKIMQGCHILVATPGRLLDFIRKNKIELSEIRFLVLDEADRMLDMGFLPDMRALLVHKTMVPANERQTLMFSATFPEEVQHLAGEFLNNYLFVAVGIVGGACSDVDQRFCSVTKFEKRNKLVELLTETTNSKYLVFVEQKRTTDFIATFLCEKNFPATSIHGDREQREREEALRDFKSGRMNILVATSVAARGLDIKNVDHVVNFDLPNSVDEYVHRIGRTGRVGNRGIASSFYDPDRDRHLAGDLVKILSQAGQPIPEFLKSGRNSGGTYGGSSMFGGRDCRNSNTEHDLGIAQETTFEEDVWN